MVNIVNTWQNLIASEDIQNLSICKIIPKTNTIANLLPEDVYAYQQLVFVYCVPMPWEDKNITKIPKGYMCRCQKVLIDND